MLREDRYVFYRSKLPDFLNFYKAKKGQKRCDISLLAKDAINDSKQGVDKGGQFCFPLIAWKK